MTAVGTVGATAFAALVWGSILLVLAVFAYEIYGVAGELGPR